MSIIATLVLCMCSKKGILLSLQYSMLKPRYFDAHTGCGSVLYNSMVELSVPDLTS